MKSDYSLDIFISSIGGLGLIGLTRKLAVLLSNKYENVLTGESRGIAQRRGSVSSVIRAGKSVRSPKLMLDRADVVVALESFEIIRKPKIIKPGTLCIISDLAIQNFGGSQHKIKYPKIEELTSLIQSMGGRPVVIPFSQYAKTHQLRNVHVSTVMLGVLATLLGFSEAQLKEANMLEQLDEKNREALIYGLHILPDVGLNVRVSDDGSQLQPIHGQTAA